MTVELDVFSGQPNPSWTLTEDAILNIEQKMKNLPEIAETSGFENDALGFRGFILTVKNSVQKKDTKLRVYKGHIFFDTGKSFQDIQGIEQLLIQQAKDHGFESLL